MLFLPLFIHSFSFEQPLFVPAFLITICTKEIFINVSRIVLSMFSHLQTRAETIGTVVGFSSGILLSVAMIFVYTLLFRFMFSTLISIWAALFIAGLALWWWLR